MNQVCVQFLDQSQATKYDEFLLESKTTLFYTSDAYRKMLKDFLSAEDFYLLAADTNNEIVGVMPCFLKRNRRFGNILNSLPFYGSNGGIIEHNGSRKIRRCLIDAFDLLARSMDCISATVITSPFETDIKFYDQETRFERQDERIGQITRLPKASDSIHDSLLEMVEGVRRRNIRKASKGNITVVVEGSMQTTEFLATTHIQNIEAIGGIAKPKRFFELIPRYLNFGHDYKIFTAIKDGKPVAALLLFYFNKTVEYFCPVILEKFRSLQPLSLLIFEAMKDAVREGFEWWNWGGTWHDQKQLYNFKKRWGTQDYPYYYYSRIYDEANALKGLSREIILSEYPFFYVIPFSQIC